MIMSKLVAWTAAFAFVLGVAHVAPVLAAEGESTQADVVGEASSPSPKSPIKVSIVDYVKEGDGPGTLKLAGTAIASSDVYIYLDDKPFAHIVAADDGKWSVEDKTELDDSAHVVRVEQFDETTRMLAGRAQFNISLSPPDPADLAPRP
jgi:hypothetical protein